MFWCTKPTWGLYTFICLKVSCGRREIFMETLCTEDCTVLIFASSTNIVYLILSAKLTKAVYVRNESYFNKLRITLLVPDNVSVRLSAFKWLFESSVFCKRNLNFAGSAYWPSVRVELEETRLVPSPRKRLKAVRGFLTRTVKPIATLISFNCESESTI